MTKREKILPTTSTGDHLHAVAKAGLAAVPILGGPAAELFTQVIVPPLTKRREAWLQGIADDLAVLEEKVEGFTTKSLASNEEFITLLMQVSQIAITTHRNEKLAALRNVLSNSAVKTPDEYLQVHLLSFLDIATPWHFQVLRFYGDPADFLDNSGLTIATGDYLSTYVVRVFKELDGKDAFRLQIERDLLHYGLILPEEVWYSERTTNTGDKVIAMLESPIS